MREIMIFVEDFGHEIFIKTLINRIGRETDIDCEIQVRNAIGGKGKTLNEYKKFIKDISNDDANLPDLLIVAIDSNCKGYSECKRVVDEASRDYKNFYISAMPDPHIEKWLMLDSHAFKKIFGRGCNLPKDKCDKDRYKNILREEIEKSGIRPPLGGLEYIEDLVLEADFNTMKSDSSFQIFYKDLLGKMKDWQNR